MSLASKLAHEFSTSTKFKGSKYHQGGAVELVNETPTDVDAIVRGSEDYLVRLVLGRVALGVACTCPYFDSGNECKHIWATILKVDENHFLPGADLIENLKLDFDYEALEELRDIDSLKLSVDPYEDNHKYRSDQERGRPEKLTPIQAGNVRSRNQIEPEWKAQLSILTNAVRSSFSGPADTWPSGREIFYIVDAESTRMSGKLTVELSFRDRTMKGEWGKIKSQRISLQRIPTIPEDADRQILTILSGAREAYTNSGYYGYGYDSLSNRCQLSLALQELVLPLMCATGRCRLRRDSGDQEMPTVVWDESDPWDFWVISRLDEPTDEYVFHGVLRRGEESVEVTGPPLLVEGLLIDQEYRVARLAGNSAFAWLQVLRKRGELRVPAAHAIDLIEELLRLPVIPNFDVPPELQFKRVVSPPNPRVVIRRPRHAFAYNSMLDAELSFEYGETRIEFTDERQGVYDRASRCFIVREPEAERRAADRLKPLGFKLVRDYYERRRKFELAPSNLPRAVNTLLLEGWKVEAEGKLYRRSGSLSLSVSSGIDWFELQASVDFGDGLRAELPALLGALKRGETMVQLGDGSFGLLPEEWLKQYGLLVSLGETAGGQLRFKRSQTGLLDALLAAQPDVKFDENFARARDEWERFRGIEALDPPSSFCGTLRNYQSEGLGWFEFLRRFAFGGCLADDMGLGKTVQVLALLESRRVLDGDESPKTAIKKRAPKSSKGTVRRVTKLPCLVVVPRSLVFNWQQEAARFTPQLRILTHFGAERAKGSRHFQEYDVILTTYGTLRRDAEEFGEAEFDYAVLDEAQAIKNARTESAKAARLLKAKHRLALSGTPIENHLGELWSLFEFLNPGMLGAASVFQLAGANARSLNEETRALLARALRPFILRRTKQQVAKELPEKLEQTIYCEMEASQRGQYEELLKYYRASLLEKVESLGINRTKLHILEALLRLRQAACHPALVSKTGLEESSAKLEMLLPQLREVIDEGHKALVFSQFTSFLGILRLRLDNERLDYEYLDGKTRDRAGKVERFQNDPGCKLFLISLKAGGLGLNLTAAEYVFLLDPWWNPAVETQAIDRAHRIGQSRRVFAYRLITRGTVEEKVVALQSNKRELADSIISADENLIKNITKEDLLLLLS